MKKFVYCIMVILMVNCIASADTTNETKGYDLFLTKAFDYTADYWLSDDYSRAMLTVLLTSDLMFSSNGEITIDVTQPTYIMMPDTENLLVIAHTNDSQLMIMFNANSKNAYYGMVEDGITDKDIREIYPRVFGKNGFFENNSEAILEASMDIYNALQK